MEDKECKTPKIESPHVTQYTQANQSLSPGKQPNSPAFSHDSPIDEKDLPAIDPNANYTYPNQATISDMLNYHIFHEPPTIHVLEGSIPEDTWPAVPEYTVEVTYRHSQWKIRLTKTNIYYLWFYLKRRPQLMKKSTVTSPVPLLSQRKESLPTLANYERENSVREQVEEGRHTKPEEEHKAEEDKPEERTAERPEEEEKPTRSNRTIFHLSGNNGPSFQDRLHHYRFSQRKKEDNKPSLRMFFLASNEKSIRKEYIKVLEKYLQHILQYPEIRAKPYVLSLLQVSRLSFEEERGYSSLKEAWLKVRIWLKENNNSNATEEKKTQRQQCYCTCDTACCHCNCLLKRPTFHRRHLRWILLKKSCLLFCKKPTDQETTAVALFDQNTTVERGMYSAGSRNGLVITNNTFRIEINAKTKRDAIIWTQQIRAALHASKWTKIHRDESFANVNNPVHIDSFAKWYTDGETAYHAIYQALMSAKKTIFIAGWWICPSIYLKRDTPNLDETYRLDNVLKRKADSGVDVYILMYKEVSLALTLNSAYSKEVFNALGNNVHVLRDPDFIMRQFGLWSHHEKIVVIDQVIGFVGGLDLCFGRWDTNTHPLFDTESKLFKGKDYSNPRIKDFIDVHLPDIDLINRKEIPRMPWHDCHCRLEGQPARDLSRHFIQRWNYCIAKRSKTSKLYPLIPKDSVLSHEQKLKTMLLQQPTLGKRNLEIRSKFQKVTKKVQQIQQFQRSISNKEEIKKTAEDEKKSKGFHSFIKFRDSHNEEDKTDENFGIEDAIPTDSEKLKEEVTKGFPCECQIVRSLAGWSGGCPKETSIHNAYIRLIKEAKVYIYIENQFFVSGFDGDALCQNRIVEAIFHRILRAAENGEDFRVMIFLPLLPAFEGKINDKEAYSLRGILHWQYRTICRGVHSLYHHLSQHMKNPFKYIAFFSLRKWEYAPTNDSQRPITEQIYIHSKLMIIDDKKVIIGSANINERSMNGDRDSEIAVVIEDHEYLPGIRLGSESQDGVHSLEVGKFAHSFRMALFTEHFNFKDPTELINFIPSEKWFALQEIAMKNTSIYNTVFGCLPSDSIREFKQLNGGNELIPITEPTTTENNNRRRNSLSNYIRKSKRKSEKKRDRNVSDSEDQSEIILPSVPEEDVQIILNKTPNKGVNNQRPEMEQLFNSYSKDLKAIQNEKQRLEEIQGSVVYFPLHFLSNENLEPAYYPSELFQ